MKAVVITDPNGPEALRVKDVPSPTPGPSELRVRVRATALNRADLLQTMGLYPAPKDAPPDIPGLEYAGEVLEVGSKVQRFKVGDRVMGLVGGGAFAEELTCHEREALPIPTRFSFSEAAAIPEAFYTAFDAMVLQAELEPTETVLVHAAGSGVGTAGCQIARAWGATVIGTSRTPDKLERLKAYGMDHGVATGSGEFAKQVMELTHGRGVDVVLDLIGGSAVDETLSSLAKKARWVVVGLMAGPSAELNLSSLMDKRAQLIGTVLRSRGVEEKIEVALAVEKALLPLFEAGKLKPVIDSTFAMTKLQDAFARLSSNASFGKIVVEW